MANYFKKKYKIKSGETKESDLWTIRFHDHLLTRRDLAVYKDLERSERLGRWLEKLVEKRRSREPLNADDMAWLELLPNVHRNLVKWEVVEKRSMAAQTSVYDHLDDFKQYLTNQKRTDFHVKQQTRRIKRILDGIRVDLWNDISGEDIQAILASWTRDGMGLATANHYLTAFKTFANWMIKTRRTQVNPVLHLSKYNADVDVRRVRRVLTLAECETLIENTSGRPLAFGMTGWERSLLYILTLETGFRWSELRSLKVINFDLDSDQPTVRVDAAYSKHRRQDKASIRSSVARMLKIHLYERDDDDLAFHMWSTAGSKMIRADLEAVGIEYKDRHGHIADFHALRHTFITNLYNCKTDLVALQKLARHSTSQLTLDRYTHTSFESNAEAINNLPDLASGRAGNNETPND